MKDICFIYEFVFMYVIEWFEYGVRWLKWLKKMYLVLNVIIFKNF